MPLCNSEAAEISVPSFYTNVIWYRTINGTATQVGTGNTLLVSDVGSYLLPSINLVLHQAAARWFVAGGNLLPHLIYVCHL
ncbi:MAG: hypothetical protein R2822_12600 [Spirosomataceae bacterium]